MRSDFSQKQQLCYGWRRSYYPYLVLIVTTAPTHQMSGFFPYVISAGEFPLYILPVIYSQQKDSTLLNLNFKEILNASRPSEHPPVSGGKCQNV